MITNGIILTSSVPIVHFSPIDKSNPAPVEDGNISNLQGYIYIYIYYICLIYLLGFRQWNPQHFQSASESKNRNLRSSLPGLVANVESSTTNQGMVFGARASRGEYQVLGVGPVVGYPVSTGWSICLFCVFFLGKLKAYLLPCADILGCLKMVFG